MPTKNKTSNKKFTGFSNEEQAAMRERALELKTEERMSKNKAEGEETLLAKVAQMPGGRPLLH
ncbi:MAG TPA: hypothetical protein VGA89_02030 [Patescibacteria group bacterium]|jgi:hypothetical protein